MIRALQTCRFGGKDYRKGETVPESAVDKKFIGSLARMKIIEVADAQPQVKKSKPKTPRTKKF